MAIKKPEDRDEFDLARIAKAEAKRKRKAEKLAKQMGGE